MLRTIKTLLPLLALTIGSFSWGTTAEQFRGQATSVNVTVLGISTKLGDTGALPSKGGALQASLLTLNVPLVLSGGVAQSQVIGVGNHTDASSTVAGLNVLTNGLGITADLIQSHAYVVGSATQAPVGTGSSQIANLSINGTPIIVTGAPNQTINVALGTVVLNEVIQSAGAVTVNAIHIKLVNLIDVQLAHSYAQVGPCTGCTNACTGTPNCTGLFDFLTGGGSLLNSLKADVNFAVALGLNNGKNWGGFVFNDPTALINLEATTITQYIETSATERTILGTGTLNGLSTVNYTLDVIANGQGGSTFTLTLSNGYTITGQVNLGFLHILQACN